MFSIWINRILSSLGILRIIPDFLVLVKVKLTYKHLEMMSKVFIIPFLLCLWGWGTKTNQKSFFQISAHVYSLLDQTEEKRKVFFGKGREG